MKPDKFEDMAEKWMAKCDPLSLAKLLRRVYRMGHKEGYCKGGHDLAKILKETR